METEWYEPAAGKHKYSDIWQPDWREDVDLLAREQKSTCGLCGHEMTGSARELILAFREHRRKVHGQHVKPLRRRAEERLLMLDGNTTKVDENGVPSWRKGVDNSALSNTKQYTHVGLMEMRDSFFAEHGRMPTSHDPGMGNAVTNAVNRLFGSWDEFRAYGFDGLEDDVG